MSSNELGISPVFTPADGVAAAAAASAPAADGRLLSPGGRRRLNDGERPGKLSPRVHSYMTQRLQEWVAHNPGAQRPRALHAKKLRSVATNPDAQRLRRDLHPAAGGEGAAGRRVQRRRAQHRVLVLGAEQAHPRGPGSGRLLARRQASTRHGHHQRLAPRGSGRPGDPGGPGGSGRCEPVDGLQQRRRQRRGGRGGGGCGGAGGWVPGADGCAAVGGGLRLAALVGHLAAAAAGPARRRRVRAPLPLPP